MNFHKITMVGKMFLQRLASLSIWTSDDERRLVYNSADKLLYYADHEKWNSLARTSDLSAGSTQIIVDEWNPDGEKSGIKTANIWGMIPVISFSPIKEGGIWATFPVSESWDITKDISFTIDYTKSSLGNQTFSVGMDIWTTKDEDVHIGTETSPTIKQISEIITPSTSTIRASDSHTFTDKLDSSYLSEDTQYITVLLYRDISSPNDKHNGWFELINFIAYQEEI